ncbi:hypothetical protein Dimus_016208 [Dionaea muscipula]
MALAKRSEFIIKIALFIGIAMFFSEAQATRVSRSLLQSSAIFDVTRFGAKGNGKLAVNEDGDPKTMWLLFGHGEKHATLQAQQRL